MQIGCGEDVLAGQLWAHQRRGESATFVYDLTYLNRADTYALDPVGLPKSAGQHQTAAGRKMFAAFSDCAPDRWGRLLIDRATHAGAPSDRSRTEADYLLAVRDDMRQGALRFRASGTETYLADARAPVPLVVDLPRLLNAADRLADDTATEHAKISTDHVRAAAAQVYTTTKASLLNGVPAAGSLLNVIIQEVISTKKARAFLLLQEHTNNKRIQRLVDDRILHVIKRGYSHSDQAGIRYDVLQIDYGCYVQQLGTQSAPQTLFGETSVSDDTAYGNMFAGVVVPEDDYRAIRRAVLDLPAKLATIGQAVED